MVFIRKRSFARPPLLEMKSMDSFRRLIISVAVAVTSVTAAAAADLTPGQYVTQAPELVPVEIGSGWYIRGDIGYPFAHSSPNFSYRTYDSTTNTYGSTAYDPSSSIKADFSGDVGFGYQFNQFFRMDATLGRTHGKFSGSSSSASPCSSTGQVGTLCDTQDNASFTAWTGLVNAYVEPGTFMGFAPYVGAGAGMTRVNWGNLKSAEYCVDGVNGCTAPGYVGTVSHSGLGDWRFTYAFMAGLAYDLTPNLKIDLGYRYRHIAGGSMYGWDSVTAASGATGNQASDGGLTTQEVRVGLRYSIW